jgi:hypothetical protein
MMHDSSAKLTCRLLMWLAWDGTTYRLTAACFALSLVVLIVAVFAGLNSEPDSLHIPGYTVYLLKWNWSLYPLFFVAAGFMVDLSWRPFLSAWRSLNDTAVLRFRDGPVPTVELEGLLDSIASRRKYALGAAVVSAVALVTLDLSVGNDNVLAGYAFGPMEDSQSLTFAKQMNIACHDPDYLYKWLFDTWNSREVTADKAPCSDSSLRALDSAAQKWAVARPGAAWGLLSLLYIEEFALIFLASLVFWQIVLHALIFQRFEAVSPESKEITLELNPESPVREFGLEHWNHALNNIYWWFPVPLSAALLSRAFQPPGTASIGQHLISACIPSLVLAPMFATIIARQSRLARVWKGLYRKDAAAPASLYPEQLLWPLDKNWASKLGIVLTLLVVSVCLGVQVRKLL